jgi:hypothetical protein
MLNLSGNSIFIVIGDLRLEISDSVIRGRRLEDRMQRSGRCGLGLSRSIDREALEYLSHILRGRNAAVFALCESGIIGVPARRKIFIKGLYYRLQHNTLSAALSPFGDALNEGQPSLRSKPGCKRGEQHDTRFRESIAESPPRTCQPRTNVD